MATVYFGGGTPSLHPPAEIAAILEAVRSAWGIAKGAEITLEANPGTTDRQNLTGWRQAGVNRLSLGAQSFSARKLALLYRDHTVAEIRDSVAYARQAGLDQVSLDLIFGLPGENLEELGDDLASLLALEPEHISLYDLEFHAGTPFDRWRTSGKLTPLPEDLEADLYLQIHERLTREGYEHYEVSNFARSGHRAIHNSAYWEGKPYLGLGVSAHSFDGDRLRWHNVADIHRYFALIEADELPVASRHANSDRECLEEWISNSLRRVDGITREDATQRLGEAHTHALWDRAQALSPALRELSDTRFSLTAEGWFRENSILLWLFEGLGEENAETLKS